MISRIGSHVLAACLVASLVQLPGPARATPSARPVTTSLGDFNGDGFGDLAVGGPGEAVGTFSDAGAVNVLYGSADGLSSAGNQFWSQDSPDVAGRAELGDEFGFSVAAGDFNGDGFGDLAVGVPGKGVATVDDAGAVAVLYGSASGLSAAGNQIWTQGSPGVTGASRGFDQFGFSVAAGDFNGDGFADLAVGVPGKEVGGRTDPGAVSVLYGSGTGLTSADDQLWNQNSSGIRNASERGDQFGTALAAGDFNADGKADLAVGVPGETFGGGTASRAGAVNVIYGSDQRLTSAGNELWTQDSPGIGSSAEPLDLFGDALATGDLNGDGAADLVVGVPFEDVGAVRDAGAINVIYGSAMGLVAAGSQLRNQNSRGIRDIAEPSDEFGFSVAVGDFNGDSNGDVAVGVPGEDVGGTRNAGAVNVLYSSPQGLSSAGNQVWAQDSPNVADGVEGGDQFGFAVSGADLGAGTQADLEVGVPAEDLSSRVDAGALNVLYGSASGLSATGNQWWTQNIAGVADTAESGDAFGFGLAAGTAGPP